MTEDKDKPVFIRGGDTQQTSRRDVYIDSLKGVLIFFVVYGHFILGNFPDGSVNCALKNFIFLFHMPLFIFLSGMFSHVKDKKKYTKAVVLLLETYLVYQFLHYIIPLPYNVGRISLFNYIVYPTWTMWYLVSLISWRILVFLIGEDFFERYKKQMIITSFIIGVMSGFVPVGHQFSLQRTMSFLPFFILGYYTKPSDVKRYTQRIPLVLALIVCIATLLGLYLVVGRDLGYVTAGSSNYYETGHPFRAMVERIISYACAIILSLSIMRLTPGNQVLADIGRQTLFIYISHSFVASVLFVVIRHFKPLGSTVSLFLLSVCATYVLAIIAKTRLRALLNPISAIYGLIGKKDRHGSVSE